MYERFAELLAKGTIGQLSGSETEELARFLNGPIIDPIVNPPAGFISKRTFEPSDVEARIRAIDWFSHCGDLVELDLSMEIEQVKNWSQAMKACKSAAWENAQLEAQNQLTLWLHNNAQESYQKWNQLVVEQKDKVVNPLTDQVLIPFQRNHGLDVTFFHSVQWDILEALMENAYFNCGHRCFFSLELLLVYEAGHFPCGWRGKWPKGKLLVY